MRPRSTLSLQHTRGMRVTFLNIAALGICVEIVSLRERGSRARGEKSDGSSRTAAAAEKKEDIVALRIAMVRGRGRMSRVSPISVPDL